MSGQTSPSGRILTPKQSRFVEEYLIDLNATQAAIRAGYSAKTANEQGSRLLANASVAEAITAGREKLSEKAEITQAMVLAELGRIGFSDIRKLFENNGRLKHITMLDDDAAACIQSIEFDSKRTRKMQGDVERDEYENEGTVKLKVWDKRAALVDIGRHLGMFTEKLEINGTLTIVADAVSKGRARVAALNGK